MSARFSEEDLRRCRWTSCVHSGKPRNGSIALSYDPDPDAIIWEHGRRNNSLRTKGVPTTVSPVAHDSPIGRHRHIRCVVGGDHTAHRQRSPRSRRVCRATRHTGPGSPRQPSARPGRRALTNPRRIITHGRNALNRHDQAFDQSEYRTRSRADQRDLCGIAGRAPDSDRRPERRECARSPFSGSHSACCRLPASMLPIRP